MKFNNYLFLVLATTVAISGCKKDVDEEAPKLSSIRINGNTGADHVVQAGESFTLALNASDNEALNQLKIDIHSAEDGHLHEFQSDEVRGSEWEVFEVISLSGTSQSVSVSYTIPNDQQGVWHLTLQCIDKEGNESDVYLVELDVENNFIPQFQLDATNPGQNEEGEIEASVGTQISLTGVVSDDSGLLEIHAELYYPSGDLVMLLWEGEFDPAGAKSFDLSAINFSIPETTASELYLTIHAVDQEGFEAELTIPIHLE